MTSARRAEFAVLLKPGERAEKLDLSGWVVLSNLLNPGDRIIIAKCYLFDRPVRATVRIVSIMNTLKVRLTRANSAKDSYGKKWKLGNLPHYLDVAEHIYRIVK